MRAGESAAWANLDQALLTLAEREQEPPCAGRWHEFAADDLDTLRRVAEDCSTCPIRDVCAGVVPYVFHGAWAGVVIAAGRLVKDTP